MNLNRYYYIILPVHTHAYNIVRRIWSLIHQQFLMTEIIARRRLISRTLNTTLILLRLISSRRRSILFILFCASFEFFFLISAEICLVIKKNDYVIISADWFCSGINLNEYKSIFRSIMFSVPIYLFIFYYYLYI